MPASACGVEPCHSEYPGCATVQCGGDWAILLGGACKPSLCKPVGWWWWAACACAGCSVCSVCLHLCLAVILVCLASAMPRCGCDGQCPYACLPAPCPLLTCPSNYAVPVQAVPSGMHAMPAGGVPVPATCHALYHAHYLCSYCYLPACTCLCKKDAACAMYYYLPWEHAIIPTCSTTYLVACLVSAAALDLPVYQI